LKNNGREFSESRVAFVGFLLTFPSYIYYRKKTLY
jgi:hypothetical protein